MQHPTEIWDSTDEWTGLADATERRKRQSRLAQRARRKRKHRERMGLNEVVESGVAASMVSTNPIGLPERILSSNHSASSNAMAVGLALALLVGRKSARSVRENVQNFLRKAFAAYTSRLPDSAHLPTLTRLNALDALIQNALVLHIPFEFLESDDFTSPFCVYGPRSITDRSFPPCLAPTALQRSISHHSWLDLFPIPRMRDNILWGIQSGQVDEDQLCEAFCCDLLNFEADSTSALTIWGDPWDITGWELSVHFFETWGWLLYGCAEVLRATNRWRTLRGDRPLSV